ncbi:MULTISPECIES: hypothetical protein [Agrobacterium]|uniref:hypothetical protein n=1 Tax=Agrobacterium TaxID=357 RepID=UPI000458AF41|nr:MULTISPECIES: hypothetical protein [Agrobacterium]AMD59392.1 hypothetical protein AWN88_14050 [Agrobacterium tumefaciens]KAJ33995.1 hypothetical protein BW45_06380 [Agrobacterium tumefaciens]MCD4659433.1 hypothetical protein [Agrobacterium sp.]NTE54383.1 hypothetical protein [Agrobacterium tumefaciens]NTE70548.1 hypothetical protein [Agrobacterium tumefaciens]
MKLGIGLDCIEPLSKLGLLLVHHSLMSSAIMEITVLHLRVIERGVCAIALRDLVRVRGLASRYS